MKQVTCARGLSTAALHPAPALASPPSEALWNGPVESFLTPLSAVQPVVLSSDCPLCGASQTTHMVAKDIIGMLGSG